MRGNEDKLRSKINKILVEKGFKDSKIEYEKSSNPIIRNHFKSASKKMSANEGYPDIIYYDEKTEILYIFELKGNAKYHESDNHKLTGRSKKIDIEEYAVDGLFHYIRSIEKKDTKIIGIACSGVHNEFILSQYYVTNEEIKPINVSSIQNINYYNELFKEESKNNIKVNLGKSAKKIAELTRDNIETSDKAPLISTLIISLYENSEITNTLKNTYINFHDSKNAKQLKSIIISTIENVLENTNGFSDDKVKTIIQNSENILSNECFANTSLLFELIDELEKNVMPNILVTTEVNTKNSIDTVGEFYRAFLKYSSGDGKDLGIVLTPHHITDLFCDLIPLEKSDILLDPCCGTGGFLISGMQKLIGMVEEEEEIDLIKREQIIGVEYITKIYALAVSNMIINGDGKTQLLQGDYQKMKSIKNIENKKPTIGFINPPYSKKKDKYKEIDFVTKLIKDVEKYVVAIVPSSTFHSSTKKDILKKKEILKKNTLLYLINMPSNLFGKDAGVFTSIAVFEVGRKHKATDNVVFYNLKDDGHVNVRGVGRVDLYERWDSIKEELLYSLKNKVEIKGKSIVTNIKLDGSEEWDTFNFLQLDHKSMLKKNNKFNESVMEYSLYLAAKYNEVNFKDNPLKILEYFKIPPKKDFEINYDNWEYKYTINDLFEFNYGIHYRLDSLQVGKTPYVTTQTENNGIAQYTNLEPLFKEKALTLATDGIYTGKIFYQDEPYHSSHIVATMTIKPEFSKSLNLELGLFFKTIIELEKEKYSWARKCKEIRIKDTKLYLPLNAGNPDWDYMEKIIKETEYYDYVGESSEE